MAPGANASYTVTLAAFNGYNAPVNLTVSGVPTGAIPTFSPNLATFTAGVSTSTITVTNLPTQPGTYTLTITGTGTDAGATTHSTTVTLVVPPPDFSITASPPTQSVHRGGAPAVYTVTLTSLYEYNSLVNLTVSGLPAGATATFSPSSVTPTAGGATSTLKVTTTRSTQKKTYTLTITGTGTDKAKTTHTTTVFLQVTQ